MTTDNQEIVQSLMNLTKDELLRPAERIDVKTKNKSTKEVVANALATKLVENAIPNEPEPEMEDDKNNIALTDAEKKDLILKAFAGAEGEVDWSVFRNCETQKRKIALHRTFEEWMKKYFVMNMGYTGSSGSTTEETWSDKDESCLTFIATANANLEYPFLVSMLGELQSRRIRILTKKKEANITKNDNTKDYVISKCQAMICSPLL